MKSTLLIGLDGATFTILDPLMERGVMPFLADFCKKGARAKLLSTSNPLTPPAWTTVMTGRTPGNHGMFDFIWAQERNNNVYFTLHNFRDIRCETIWSLVSRKGGSACSLNFPMMSPPPEVSGCIIPGLVSWKHLHRNVYPRELYQELKTIPGFNARELAWDFDLEKKAAKGISEKEYENWVDFHIRREKQWFDVARHILKTKPCDLMAVLFDGLDKILHMGWRFLDPDMCPEAPTDWDIKIRDLCYKYFSELDAFLAEIVGMAGPEARVFMVSDHGFGPSWMVFRVNKWLESQGYLTWKSLEGADEKTKQSVQRLVDNHFVYLDWERTTAYARTTTSNGIYIRVADDSGNTGIHKNDYERFRNELTAKLYEVRDPESGKQVVQRVMTREEAFPGSFCDQAPDLTLVMSDHSFVSILDKEPVVCKRPEIEGTHYPEGIFIAGGPGVCRGENPEPFSIVNVAPTVLFSLGLDVPSDFEGRLPDKVFDEVYLEKNPCRIGDPTIAPDLFKASGQKEAEKKEADDQVYKQLKALGYIE